MARVKRGVTAHAKHKKVLKAAKGYYGRGPNTRKELVGCRFLRDRYEPSSSLHIWLPSREFGRRFLVAGARIINL